MKLWLPHVRAGSGVDIYTRRLAAALTTTGVDVVSQGFAHGFQYSPSLMSLIPAPAGTDVILANSWNAGAFARRGAALVSVCHLCVFDRALAPYKTHGQRLFHDHWVRRFEAQGYAAADAVVAVSRDTAGQVERAFPGIRVQIIHNGVDTGFYCPGAEPKEARADGLDILFVGNLSRRKGADLLPAIMSRLGHRHRLYYTCGRKPGERLPAAPNLHPLGRLDETAVRDAYRRADVVLLPTRLEGLPLAALEGMACGRAVVTSRVGSLPELIEHGETGWLCPVDDADAFAAAIDTLSRHPARRHAIGAAARQVIEQRFSAAAMARRYLALFLDLPASHG